MIEGELGLRERKKLRTRQALIDAAIALYREKGYEGVTVAEIARRADVSTRTFFSYFETKEDVFLVRADQGFARLAQSIRDRHRGEPLLSSLRRDMGRRSGDEASSPPHASDLLQQPAIQARLRERWNGWEDLLAETIAADVGAAPGDPEPRVVAAAVTGAIRVAAAAAEEQPQRRREILTRVFDLLADGLAEYGLASSRPDGAQRPR